MKLDYLNTTTCEWQNHNLVSNKVVSNKLVSQGCICVTSNVINNKTYNELSQTVRLTVQVFKNHHDCNPFQSSSHHDFVLFYVPFLPPFNVLSSYFYVSLNLRWWFPKLYMINFVTELSLLLTNGILKRLWLQGLEKWTFVILFDNLFRPLI